MIRHPLLAALVAAQVLVAPLAPARAQVQVYDPANHAQNLLTAARALQQVNNQLTALQNQAEMLRNQARQLTSLDYSALSPIRDALGKIDALMVKADGLSLDLRSTQALLDQAFPTSLNPNAATRETADAARTQAKAALESYRQALQVQAQIVENVRDDKSLIDELVTRSQGAVGGLQAQQAANQLQAVAIKQDQQLQTLIAAQYRADALERARQAQALEAGKLATRRFIGGREAYSPR